MSFSKDFSQKKDKIENVRNNFKIISKKLKPVADIN